MATQLRRSLGTKVLQYREKFTIHSTVERKLNLQGLCASQLQSLDQSHSCSGGGLCEKDGIPSESDVNNDQGGVGEHP